MSYHPEVDYFPLTACSIIMHSSHHVDFPPIIFFIYYRTACCSLYMLYAYRLDKLWNVCMTVKKAGCQCRWAFFFYSAKQTWKKTWVNTTVMDPGYGNEAVTPPLPRQLNTLWSKSKQTLKQTLDIRGMSRTRMLAWSPGYIFYSLEPVLQAVGDIPFFSWILLNFIYITHFTVDIINVENQGNQAKKLQSFE